MDPDLELTGFEGTCRLFPLKGVVLFPHCVLPLHIFEPRYRQMTEDALAGDRLIAIAQVGEGVDWKKVEAPPIEPVACLGKIFDHQRLADGRFNILLVGLKRIRIDRELSNDRLYRTARVTVLDDVYPESPIDALRGELVDLFREMCEREARIEPEIARLLDKPLPLGVLSDLLGHYLGLSPEARQAFLAEVSVEQRTRNLIRVLHRHLGGHRRGRDDGADGFPPPFSVN